MEFDLIANQRFRTGGDGLLDQGDGEIGNADVPRQPELLDTGERAERSLSGMRGLGQCSSKRSTTARRSLFKNSFVERSRSFGAKWEVKTLVVTKTSSRLTPEARKASPTSRSFS